ncbi:hypothetical protein [Sphingomonas xanthus]|uniref:Uncharacterized protein n=1 Tax=Sphingomonas xanthus TaxID=2594473 RepID=A0A516ITJ7_9SPHN|nr:hypothetical protein [Sphingomonas xanthus]QDP20228.1 hypothetical protein FMM02_09850 [Sphingomonas xanthus]
MTWGAKHPLERIVEGLAPALLALAVGWSALQLGSGAALAGGLAAVSLFGAGSAIIRAGGDALRAGPSFEPADLPEAEAAGELLLDDPLVVLPQDSRVVQLFAPVEPTPGELVERIADFLDARPQPRLAAQTLPSVPVDASVALHAALANIRASLR